MHSLPDALTCAFPSIPAPPQPPENPNYRVAALDGVGGLVFSRRGGLEPADGMGLPQVGRGGSCSGMPSHWRPSQHVPCIASEPSWRGTRPGASPAGLRRWPCRWLLSACKRSLPVPLPHMQIVPLLERVVTWHGSIVAARQGRGSKRDQRFTEGMARVHESLEGMLRRLQGLLANPPTVCRKACPAAVVCMPPLAHGVWDWVLVRIREAAGAPSMRSPGPGARLLSAQWARSFRIPTS